MRFVGQVSSRVAEEEEKLNNKANLRETNKSEKVIEKLDDVQFFKSKQKERKKRRTKRKKEKKTKKVEINELNLNRIMKFSEKKRGQKIGKFKCRIELIYAASTFIVLTSCILEGRGGIEVAAAAEIQMKQLQLVKAVTGIEAGNFNGGRFTRANRRQSQTVQSQSSQMQFEIQQQQQQLNLLGSTSGRPAPSSIRNVTAQNGQSVLLHCPMEPPGGDLLFTGAVPGVSWFRGAGEPQLLAYESNTVIDDERFVVRHGLLGPDDWALQIKNLDKATDSGLYQCQTHAEPPRSHFYQLNIVEPQVHILGAPDMAVKLGAAINLTCVISQSPDQLQFIFWYKDGHVINYEINESRGGKIVISKWPHKLDTITSNLQIFHSKLSDSGNYTCQPPGARPISIQVHVLEGTDKRLIMFQNDYEPSAASSQQQQQQQTNSAISMHVVRLSKGRVYALFVAFLIFSSWYHLVAQTQTAFSLLLLAIIGFFLGILTERKEEEKEENEDELAKSRKQHLLREDLSSFNSPSPSASSFSANQRTSSHTKGSRSSSANDGSSSLADTLQPLIISRQADQQRERQLQALEKSGEKKPRNRTRSASSLCSSTSSSSSSDSAEKADECIALCSQVIVNTERLMSCKQEQQHLAAAAAQPPAQLAGHSSASSSPSSSSSASTGYNSDSRSTTTNNHNHNHTSSAQKVQQANSERDQPADMIELLTQPSALHLIMDQFSGATRALELNSTSFHAAAAACEPAAHTRLTSSSSPAPSLASSVTPSVERPPQKPTRAEKFSSLDLLMKSSGKRDEQTGKEEKEEEPHYSSPSLLSSYTLSSTTITTTTTTTTELLRSQQNIPPSTLSSTCDCP